MGLRINTNLAALSASRSMSLSSRQAERSMKQLATGSRFADVREGAADFAISEHLRGQVRGMQSAKMNAENAVSFTQLAEGSLSEQNNIMIRLRELAIQSANDTFSDADRETIQKEFSELKEEFERIALSTRFGDHKLLSGDSKDFEFQVGTYKGDENVIKYTSSTNTTLKGVGISGVSVATKGDARSALEDIDEGLKVMGEARAGFGAIQSRLSSASDNASTAIENLSSAHSKIADTDYAQAVSEVAKQKVLQQFQISVLAQANQQPGNVLRLLA